MLEARVPLSDSLVDVSGGVRVRVKNAARKSARRPGTIFTRFEHRGNGHISANED